jgi:hypothetical protein
VAQNKPHVSVGGLLGAGPFWGKGHFWREKHEVKEKDNWKEKQHMRGKLARCACKGNLTTLGLGFLQDIVMDDKPIICISST